MTKKDDAENSLAHELDIEKDLMKTGDIEDLDAEYSKLYTKGIVPETDDPSAPSIVLPRGILNPGPFTIKEHVLVYMIASAAGGQPYGVENVIGQKFDKFMGDADVTFWNSVLFVITTQMIGYGLSVDPYIFATALQAVSILCLVKSSSQATRFLGSSSPNTGVGILSLSFDWSNIGSALASPYTFEDGTSMPILNSPGLFNKNGVRTRATRFYDRTTFELNTTAYDLVKPIYLTEMFAIGYSMSFFALTCGISHVALWYHKDIIRQTKEMISQVEEANPDIHNQLMRAYPEIPEWLYLGWLAIWLVVMVFVGIFTPFRLPWWGTIFGLVLAFVFLIPYGIIQGSSGQQLGLNIITELLMGLIIPGQTVAVMTFKSYSYNIMIQALSLTYDLKVGHYLHINPIHMVISHFGEQLLELFATLLHSPYFSLNLGYLFGLILPVLPWLANRFMPHPYWRFIHFPIMSGIASAGGIQSSLIPSVVISFIFMYYMFSYKHAWWTKYNYVLASALDSGSGVGVLFATIVAMRVTIPLSAVNPPMYDYYCTGTNWNDPQFG
ncbi:hypothetical protein BASA81_017524 [Batrachochytrium salamandrivorans]|nr:hypothetical protein BASA81_017524 [Batrachochytrium salamandrivorans]